MVLSHQSPRPIFLLGNIRSGTSLLSRMLNCHPGICVPYEAHIYNVFWDFRDRYEPLTDPTRQRHLAKDVLSMRVFRDWSRPPDIEAVMKHIEHADFHGVFEAVMRAWANGQQKPRWGEKTPHNGPYWRAISEGFPNAQFIHLVRDGRDCAQSMIKARFGPKLTYPAANRWARYLDEMQRMREGLGPARVYEARYEDLLGNPEQTLRGLCDFLGETYDPAMLDFHALPDNYMTDRRNRKNLKKPVMKGNTQKWKKSMSPRNQRLFEAVAGTQLARHGYPLLHPNARIGNWERWFYSYLLHPPLRALAMIRNTKGWGDGLIRLRVKLRLMLTPHDRAKPTKVPV
jgi:Sulfotransferase family